MPAVVREEPHDGVVGDALFVQRIKDATDAGVHGMDHGAKDLAIPEVALGVFESGAAHGVAAKPLVSFWWHPWSDDGFHWDRLQLGVARQIFFFRLKW